MALNPVPIGKAIADYLFNNRPNTGTPTGIADVEALWENVMTMIYNDIKANMDVLPVGHSGPGLQNPSGQPVAVSLSTGIGDTTAAESITGMGSVN